MLKFVLNDCVTFTYFVLFIIYFILSKNLLKNYGKENTEPTSTEL